MGGSLVVVFRDFDIFGISVPPSETDAVLIVDPDAVLSLPAAGLALPDGCWAGSEDPRGIARYLVRRGAVGPP